jgi:hypothetical protein
MNRSGIERRSKRTRDPMDSKIGDYRFREEPRRALFSAPLSNRLAEVRGWRVFLMIGGRKGCRATGGIVAAR